MSNKNGGKRWTQEELEYLEARWGTASVPGIANHLGRSINAVKLRAVRLGLPGNPIDASEYITFCFLLEALGKKGTYGWAKDRWTKFGCPIKYKRMMHKKIAVIRLTDFWKWAEAHQDILDFADFEEYRLGAEPAWAKEKRKRDYRQRRSRRPWTKYEDSRLRAVLDEYRYSYDDLQRMFDRSEQAIRRRITTLGIKARPVRNAGKWWTEEEATKLVQMHSAGDSWEKISAVMGRSAQACRGKYERICNPEYMTRRVRDGLKDNPEKDSCTHYTKARGCTMRGDDCSVCPHYCQRPDGEPAKTGWISTKSIAAGAERVREST